jgi:hypothetical protein
MKIGQSGYLLVTGYWMLEKGVARAAQAFTPRVALLHSIKSTGYLVNPVSSIQYPASGSVTGASSFSDSMTQL